MKRGFSLVELSIVLVILGLLVGGILAGQSLIKAASMRKTLNFQSEFQTVFNAFRDKYMALPGDFNNATAFWGRRTGTVCPSDPGTVSATGTCNGNGDGKIAWSSPLENYFLIYHLYLAGMLATTTNTGLFDDTPYYRTPGQSERAYSFVGSNTEYADLYRAAAPNGQYAMGNALQNSARTDVSQVRGAIAFAEDVWNMDVKMDDGMPNTGIFRASNGRLLTDNSVIEDCLVLSGSVYQYNVVNTTLACRYMTLLN